MKFKTFALSVHGKKYRERGLPCQDFADVLEFNNVQAIAVADGHGGKDYFRSDTGSRLAVKVAFEQIKTFCDDTTNYKIFSENGIRSFELKLWEEWRKAVKADWDKRLEAVFELGDDEPRWENVSDKYKARYTSSDERYIPVAYGTTLICAVSIGSQVLIVQIGDGSCIILQRNGEFKLPIPPDNDNFGYVTTSLCDTDAYKKFRHVVLDCSEDSPLAPTALFLSTDGLDDCYPIGDNDKYLYKLYADTVIDSMINSGFDKTQEELRNELLPYMTEHGSNDDISLAYLVTDDLTLLKQSLEELSTIANEEPSATVNEQPSATINEQPSVTVNEQPSATVNEQLSTTVNEEPSETVNEESFSPVNEEPSATVNEKPSATVNEEPSATVNEEPSATVNEQPSATVNEEPSATVNEEPSVTDAMTPGKILQETKEKLSIENKKMVESATATQKKIAEEAARLREKYSPLLQNERGNNS